MMVTPPPEIPKVGKILLTLIGLALVLLSIFLICMAVVFGMMAMYGTGSFDPKGLLFLGIMLIIAVIPMVGGIILIRQAFPRKQEKQPVPVGVWQAMGEALSERIREQRGRDK
jgi:uncharacterized membrane protein